MKKKDRQIQNEGGIAPSREIGEAIAARVMMGEVDTSAAAEGGGGGGAGGGGAEGGGESDSRWKKRLRMNKAKFGCS